MTYHPYTSCKLCSGKAQPGTVALMDYLMDMFPYAGSFGVYNCRNVAGSSTKSQHSCGRAWDCKLATLSNGRARTDLGHPIIQFLHVHSTALGIVDQIYDRVIYDDKTPGGRYYGGVHPHYDHIHITQASLFAATLTYEKIVQATGIDPREQGALMSFLPIQYGHGYKTPPAASGLAGNQEHKKQDVIYLMNLLQRVGGEFESGPGADPAKVIDGVYGNFCIEQVKKHVGGDGTSVSGWGLDNLQANAWAKIFAKISHGEHGGSGDHDHDGLYVKSITVEK